MESCTFGGQGVAYYVAGKGQVCTPLSTDLGKHFEHFGEKLVCLANLEARITKFESRKTFVTGLLRRLPADLRLRISYLKTLRNVARIG
jgi:hypothetical protein